MAIATAEELEQPRYFWASVIGGKPSAAGAYKPEWLLFTPGLTDQSAGSGRLRRPELAQVS
jgi:hypothetical protein